MHTCACTIHWITRPDDDNWGSNDIKDVCGSDGSSMTRYLYNSDNGTCTGGISWNMSLPLGVCVGPFGPPLPWGVFTCEKKTSSGDHEARVKVEVV